MLWDTIKGALRLMISGWQGRDGLTTAPVAVPRPSQRSVLIARVQARHNITHDEAEAQVRAWEERTR